VKLRAKRRRIENFGGGKFWRIEVSAATSYGEEACEEEEEAISMLNLNGARKYRRKC
jgi:hypothetical protein